MARSEMIPTPTPRYSVERVTTAEGLANLEEDWNRLSDTAASPNVFMTFDWFRAWNQRLTQMDPKGRRPNVLLLKHNGVVAGISPLIHRTASRFGYAVRKVEFVGEQADYNDLVLGSDPAGQAKAIADFLAQTRDQWDLVDLRDLREPENALPLLEDALAHAGLVHRILPEKGRCPYLPVETGSATTMQKQSGHVRRTLRKRMERASAEGLRVRVIENPHEEPGLLERLIAVERQKHIQGRLMAPFFAKYPEVFQSLFARLGPRGWVYVALLELGDRLAAWQLGFRCGKKLWEYSKAYNRAFSRFAPGTMLMLAVLDYGFAHGYEEYDFLKGEEPYKKVWSTGFHERLRVIIWSRRWLSRARAFIYLGLKTRVYQLLGRGESPA